MADAIDHTGFVAAITGSPLIRYVADHQEWLFSGFGASFSLMVMAGIWKIIAGLLTRRSRRNADLESISTLLGRIGAVRDDVEKTTAKPSALIRPSAGEIRSGGVDWSVMKKTFSEEKLKISGRATGQGPYGYLRREQTTADNDLQQGRDARESLAGRISERLFDCSEVTDPEIERYFREAPAGSPNDRSASLHLHRPGHEPIREKRKATLTIPLILMYIAGLNLVWQLIRITIRQFG